MFSLKAIDFGTTCLLLVNTYNYKQKLNFYPRPYSAQSPELWCKIKMLPLWILNFSGVTSSPFLSVIVRSYTQIDLKCPDDHVLDVSI